MGRFFFFKKGMVDGIPIFLGYFAVSITFGIAAKSAGIGSADAVLISATNLTSAGQFAALDIINTSATYLEMAFTQLVINLRYLLMSSALSQKVSARVPLWHRLIMSFGVTDEIFSVSVQERELSPFYSYGLMALAIPGWVLGTLFGVFFGDALSLILGEFFSVAFGESIANPVAAAEKIVSSLSVALYGMFISAVVPSTRRSKVIAGVVVISMLASYLFTKLPLLNEISSGFRIIILTVVIAGAAALLFPVKDEKGARE